MVSRMFSIKYVLFSEIQLSYNKITVFVYPVLLIAILKKNL